jgi:hypothetical protein
MSYKRGSDGRGIKLHRNYTVDEAARALGCSKGTVRRWLKIGLLVELTGSFPGAACW